MTVKRVIIAPDVIVRQVGGEAVILDLKTERYLSLDEVGTRIWDLLLASGSIESAYEALVQEYDVEPSRLDRDLRELVAKLIEHGLVTFESDLRPV